MVKTWYTRYRNQQSQNGNRMDLQIRKWMNIPDSLIFLGLDHYKYWNAYIYSWIQEKHEAGTSTSDLAWQDLVCPWESGQCRTPSGVIIPYLDWHTAVAASPVIFLFSLTLRVLAVPRWPCPDLRDPQRDPLRHQFPKTEANRFGIFIKPSDWWRNALLSPHWSNMGACWGLGVHNW